MSTETSQLNRLPKEVIHTQTEGGQTDDRD